MSDPGYPNGIGFVEFSKVDELYMAAIRELVDLWLSSQASVSYESTLDKECLQHRSMQ